MRTYKVDRKIYEKNVDRVPRDLCDTTSGDMSIESLTPMLATLSGNPIVPVVVSVASSALTSALINRRNKKSDRGAELDAEIARIDKERAKLDAESRRYYRESNNKSSDRSSSGGATKKTSSKDLSVNKKDASVYYIVAPNSSGKRSSPRKYITYHPTSKDSSYETLMRYGELMDGILSDLRDHYGMEETEQYIDE